MSTPVDMEDTTVTFDKEGNVTGFTELHVADNGFHRYRDRLNFDADNITPELVEFYIDEAGINKDDYDVDAVADAWRKVVEAGLGLVVDTKRPDTAGPQLVAHTMGFDTEKRSVRCTNCGGWPFEMGLDIGTTGFVSINKLYEQWLAEQR